MYVCPSLLHSSDIRSLFSSDAAGDARSAVSNRHALQRLQSCECGCGERTGGPSMDALLGTVTHSALIQSTGNVSACGSFLDCHASGIYFASAVEATPFNVPSVKVSIGQRCNPCVMAVPCSRQPAAQPSKTPTSTMPAMRASHVLLGGRARSSQRWLHDMERQGAIPGVVSALGLQLPDIPRRTR